MNSILIISGLDPTGQAGLLRDVEMALRLDQPYLTLPTAFTAQNQNQFFNFETPSPDFLKTLWQSFDLQSIAAIKIGMLANETILNFLIEKLTNSKTPVIWDPVFRSTSGGELFPKDQIQNAVTKLLPLTTLFTPNATELCEVLNIPFSENLNGKDLCLQWLEQFPNGPALYLKGGHLPTKSKDWFVNGDERSEFTSEVSEKTVRGTGCLFATAVACELAAGRALNEAAESAKAIVHEMFF